jgi:hypothetical protein
MSSVRTDKEASTTLDDALKPTSRAVDGDAVVRALKPVADDAPEAETIDGFHLVIDALKLNDIDTIFGLPGIPDHRPDAHGAGRGHAGHFVPPRAARRQRRSRSRLPDAKARHLPDGVGPRLPERPHGAGQRDHQLLPDDPHQRIERARNRRPAAGRLRRDGPAGHRQAAVQGRLPRAACPRHRRGHRPRHPLGAVGPPRRRVPGPAGQALRADHGRGKGKASLIKVVDPAPRQIPRPTRSSARSICSRAPRSR